MINNHTTISLDRVSHAYQAHQRLFEPISCTFKKGVSYGIQGPSGIGKTTLLTSIAGIVKPSEGTIRHQTESNNIITASVFQQPLLIDEFSIIENIMLGAWNSFSPALYKQAYQLLESLHLEHYAQARPRSLSVGQQQRVCLARCLIKKPDFLIADEPTAALDAQASQELFELLMKFKKEYGIGIIIGSHDQRLLGQLDEIITLKKGSR